MNQNHRLILSRQAWCMALLAYVLLGSFYWFALLYTSEFNNNYWGQTLLNYSFKALISLPVFWLIFIRLAHWPLQRRLLLHLPCLPVYLAVYIFSFYQTSEALELGHLRAPGHFWDVYIGTLIYIIQFGLLHLYEFHQQLLAQKKKEADLLKANALAETNALKAQIQPHFLFNTLNSINASLPQAQEHTRQLIARLADSFRYALQSTRADQVRLQDELDFLEDLLVLEKERFGDRLHYRFAVEPAAHAAFIAPMLLQPLLENAIKHGIGQLIEGGQIWLEVKDGQQAWQFTLSNDAPLVAGQSRGEGVGLENVRQRLWQLYRQPLHFSLAQGKATVMFLLPKQQAA